MAKNNKMKLLDWLVWIATILLSIGLADLFWSGVFLQGPVLGFLGDVIHKIIASALYLFALMVLGKMFKILK